MCVVIPFMYIPIIPYIFNVQNKIVKFIIITFERIWMSGAGQQHLKKYLNNIWRKYLCKRPQLFLWHMLLFCSWDLLVLNNMGCGKWRGKGMVSWQSRLASFCIQRRGLSQLWTQFQFFYDVLQNKLSLIFAESRWNL